MTLPPAETHYAYLDLEIGANDQIYRLGLVNPLGVWDVALTAAQPVQAELMRLQQSGSLV